MKETSELGGTIELRLGTIRISKFENISASVIRLSLFS